MTTDDAALKELISADAEARGTPVSKLGYFCVPFRPLSGPFADRVVKVYQPISDPAALDRLARAHDAYVDVLTRAGVVLPETRFQVLDFDGRKVPVITQRALDPSTMLRDQIIAATTDEAIALLEKSCISIVGFWRDLDPGVGRVGFHPSIRNFAYEDGRIVFLDTFPPLIGYSHAEMGRMLLTFSNSRAMRLLGPLAARRIAGIQDEWYSEAGNIEGIVGSAVRLRPDDADAIMTWAQGFANSEMTGDAAAKARAALSEPPRLPGYWTAIRKMLGLQGEPNV